MKNLELYIDIREEMELLKGKQQIAFEDGNTQELWKLQIVWEYLRDKMLLNDEAPNKNEYLN